MGRRPFLVLAGGDAGAGNLGDELLLRATLESYRPILDSVSVCVTMRHPRRVGGQFRVVSDDPVEFARAGIDVSDVVFLHYYGGGFLCDHWYDANTRLYRHLVGNGLPPDRVAFTGQGVGPLSEQRVSDLGRIASESFVFGTRDGTDLAGSSAVLSFDDTILLWAPDVSAPGPRADGPVALSIRDESYVGLDPERRHSVLSAIDAYVAARHTHAVGFGMVSNWYYDESEAMTRALSEAGVSSVQMHGRPSSFDELTDHLRACRATITTSYHIALISLYVGTPAVALVSSDYYRLKFDGLADTLSSAMLGVVRVDDFDGRIVDEVVAAGGDEGGRTALWERLADLRQSNEETHRRIRSRVLELCEAMSASRAADSFGARFARLFRRVR